ncbi:MAG: hypothetical protein GMKNLPBB_00522 [Myxococcota bacterium]|nr:hypothetical protein [Myxococcota bacterium]
MLRDKRQKASALVRKPAPGPPRPPRARETGLWFNRILASWLSATLLCALLMGGPAARAEGPPSYEVLKQRVTGLRADAKRRKNADEWRKLVDDFKRFLAADRAHPDTPRAMYLLGGVYEQIHALAKDRADLDRALDVFSMLHSAWPDSNLADDGAYKCAFLYETAADNPELARVYYNIVLNKFPNGDMAPLARARLETLPAPNGPGEAAEAAPAAANPRETTPKDAIPAGESAKPVETPAAQAADPAPRQAPAPEKSPPAAAVPAEKPAARPEAPAIAETEGPKPAGAVNTPEPVAAAQKEKSPPVAPPTDARAPLANDPLAAAKTPDAVPAGKAEPAAPAPAAAPSPGEPAKAVRPGKPRVRQTTLPVNKTGKLEAVKHWSNKTYTRIALYLDNPVHFRHEELPADAKNSKPPRLFLDLKPGVAKRDLMKPLPVQDAMLQQIRVGQFDKETVRVVLDLNAFQSYRIYTLENPFRILVDVTAGDPPPEEESSQAPAKKEIPAAALEEKPPAAAPPAAPAAPEKTSPPAPPPANGKIGITLSQPAGALVETAKPESAAARENRPETILPASAAPADSVLTAAIPGPGSSDVRKDRPVHGLIRNQIKRVVIDPGHGGHDHGAIGKRGVNEKDVVLKISRSLAKMLREELGVEVTLTREDDRFIELEERSAIARTADADLFISIHANASPSRKVRGISCYYLNKTDDRAAAKIAARENAMSEDRMSDLEFILLDLDLSTNVTESRALAHAVQKHMVQQAGEGWDEVVDMGVRSALFVVLLNTNTPSVLVETSFISNPDEEKRLNSRKYRDALARGIFNGLKEFIQNHSGGVVE